MKKCIWDKYGKASYLSSCDKVLPKEIIEQQKFVYCPYCGKELTYE